MRLDILTFQHYLKGILMSRHSRNKIVPCGFVGTLKFNTKVAI